LPAEPRRDAAGVIATLAGAEMARALEAYVERAEKLAALIIGKPLSRAQGEIEAHLEQFGA
jgi:hypothetical protein